MQLQSRRIRASFALAMAGAVALLSGCGDGGGSSAAPAAPTTTALSTTVIDGAIQNALVCLDKNANGACDTGEPQGRTDVAGKVTFDVANEDIGKYVILAIVGTDARDADSGPVTTAYSMIAPADKTAVVSPLTTLVQQVISDTGATTTEAAQSVQSLTGVTVSLFQDYTTAAASGAGTNPATLARMIVVTTQEQSKVIASAVGTNAADGAIIKKADLDKAIRKKMLERMPALLTAISQPGVAEAAPGAVKEAALLAAATTLATDSSALTVAAIPTLVAINNQIANPPPVTAYVPGNGATLAGLTFTDATNYFARFFTASVAQDTPDATNHVKYVDRRYRSVAGNFASWGIGGNPANQADLNWNGSAWVACPINFESTSTIRDAQNNSTYTYCDNRETGKNSGARFDISGKTIASVVADVLAAGFTNLNIANASSVLGSATFPSGSFVRYNTGTSLTTAISYYPAGKDNPPGVSNVVSQYSTDISAGGVASSQPAGTLCNSTEFNGNGTTTTTLEGMVASHPGSPCVFTGGSFVYPATGGVTYTNPDPTNEAWGGTVLSLGTLGTAAVGFGPAPGFYTSNTRFRVGFNGTGSNPTSYYACKERFNTGSTRNCVKIGTGSYAITTLGDARVMTFNNLPAQMAPLAFNRVFVERGGVVYYGYQNKLSVTQNARLNTTAGNALLTQLGMPLVDPTMPLALTGGSYAGTYDINTAGPSHPNGVIVFANSNGTSTCQDAITLANESTCTVTITNPATGAFSATVGSSSFTGSLNFLTGIGSGTLSAPDSGNFTVLRR